jgi:3-isopropylmalate dehydrogenase
MANPLATILSAALLLRYTAKREDAAVAIEQAVEKVLLAGYRTLDIMEDGCTLVSTEAMGNAVRKELN